MVAEGRYTVKEAREVTDDTVIWLLYIGNFFTLKGMLENKIFKIFHFRSCQRMSLSL